MLNIHWILTSNTIKRIKLELSDSFLMTFSTDSPLQKSIHEWTEAYLTGKHTDQLLPYFNLNLSPFSKAVLKETFSTAFGETITYGKLAEKIKNPKAARAVGNALHNNPFPLVIPCHRIVQKGALGGFAYGGEMKRRLLEFEASVP